MRRSSLGFQQQCYADETQQQSYAVHEESWSSKNDHPNQFQGMHMRNGASVGSKLSKQHGMFKDGYHHGYVSGDKRFPSGGASLFSNGSKFNSGGHRGHGYFSEESEYESHSEVHRGPTKVEVDEMRYERHNYGGDGYYANPHHARNANGIRNVEWGVKGV